MKTRWIEHSIKYDGSQLRPLYAYEKHGLLGDSIISWIGPCDVTLEHMVDYEDKIQNARIAGDQMLHFILEIFDSSLLAAVSLQRLLTAVIKDQIYVMTAANKKNIDLFREGDDLYLVSGMNKGKLSISIASKSSVSVMVHFALNVTNEGTPVETAALSDLLIDAKELSSKIMAIFSQEFLSIREATQKVKPL